MFWVFAFAFMRVIEYIMENRQKAWCVTSNPTVSCTVTPVKVIWKQLGWLIVWWSKSLFFFVVVVVHSPLKSPHPTSHPLGSVGVCVRESSRLGTIRLPVQLRGNNAVEISGEQRCRPAPWPPLSVCPQTGQNAESHSICGANKGY